MIDLSTEQIIAHLTVLGWWPVEVQRASFKGLVKALAISNGRQYFYVHFNRVDITYAPASVRETEWWRFPDDSLRKLVLTIDSLGIGGWSGE